MFRKYINLTVITTVLNLDHFWISEAELCLKIVFVEGSFIFVRFFFFRYLWKSQEKKLYKPFLSQDSKKSEIKSDFV